MRVMTGMTCTHAPFEGKLLSMESLVGTITTSQHPLLGPLLHVSDRNISAGGIEDLQIGDGAVDSSWMGRMWDEVVVAGIHYTRHERMNHLGTKTARKRSGTGKPQPITTAGFVIWAPASTKRGFCPLEIVQPEDTSRGFSKPNNLRTSSPCQDCRTLWTRSDGD